MENQISLSELSFFVSSAAAEGSKGTKYAMLRQVQGDILVALEI
jgi:hypothetical protein